MTATVSGNVAMTNSHLKYRSIPIGLPAGLRRNRRRRARKFLPDPPFRIKFDFPIKTKDPVLIRGNLATGQKWSAI
jgi:hypothetical protein